MLLPKNTKHRKQHKGRIHGKAKGNQDAGQAEEARRFVRNAGSRMLKSASLFSLPWTNNNMYLNK